MNKIRLFIVTLFVAFIATVAVASPLAAENPELAVVCSLGLLWGGALLISPVPGENLGGKIHGLQFCALSAPAALKLDTILRKAGRALEKRLSPVLALSTVMRDQVLTETDTLQVPFYALETLASKDFDGAYNFTGADGAVGTKPVTVNKRKYQPLEFTSKELRRNSVLDLEMVLMLKIEKLAEDILNDIFSVVTAANYGAAIFTGAANTFDRADVADIRTAVNLLHWPQAGRALVLESNYEGALNKDGMTINTAQGDEIRREGAINRMGGFDIFDHPGMPANGENLVGVTLLPYAILTAFSPIEPAEEVRDNLSDYRKYTSKHGLTLEYRSWGDPDSDKAKRLIEVNYGYAKGDTAQLRRLVSA